MRKSLRVIILIMAVTAVIVSFLFNAQFVEYMIFILLITMMTGGHLAYYRHGQVEGDYQVIFKFVGVAELIIAFSFYLYWILKVILGG